MQLRRLSPLLSLLVACGGGKTGPDARAPGGEKSSDGEHESIGAIAAEHGGIAALGGAGNREETGTEIAFAGPLRLETLSKKSPPKLDGVVKEWHARTPANETISGKTDGLSFEVAVQSGDDQLWLAAEIGDPNLVRSGKFGTSEDHVSLTIAFPSGPDMLKAYAIGFWPGVPGSFAGAVKWLAGPNAGQKVAGAKLVEADAKGGVTFEAVVPWSSFPDAVRVGIRASFQYHDGDGTAVTGVLGTSGGSVDKPNELAALPIAAEQAVVEGLLEQKGLAGTKPKIDVYADVAGDERKERVSVFGPFFTICGPGYRRGKQFFWREVTGEIVSLDTSPVTGRGAGKEDLVLRRRVVEGGTTHDILEVWTFPAGGEEPTTAFAAQVAVASADGKHKVTNAARLGNKEIEVTTQPAVGWDASSFHESVANNMEPILVPWGTVKSRTYRLEGARFVKASEVAQAGAPAPAAPAAATPTSPAEPRVEPPQPSVQRGSDLGKAVLDAYLKDAGLPAGTKPRFDYEVNVDGDARPERVAVFGRDIVVLGPAFKGGTGYARLSLTQFAAPEDLTEVTVRDLTGDGAAEILVRGTRHAKAPTGETVDIDGLFLYQVKGGNVGRVFSIETGRQLAGKRAQGLVQFVPAKSGKAFDIDVRPGAVKGWTQATYPWPQEKPGGAIEPLLLPWGSPDHLRYAWNGSQFVP